MVVTRIGDAPHLFESCDTISTVISPFKDMSVSSSQRAARFVEAARRLVENQQLGQRIERIGQQHAAQLAARQRRQRASRRIRSAPRDRAAAAIRRARVARRRRSRPDGAAASAPENRRRSPAACDRPEIAAARTRCVRVPPSARRCALRTARARESPTAASFCLRRWARRWRAACRAATLNEKFDRSASRAGRSVRPEISSKRIC